MTYRSEIIIDSASQLGNRLIGYQLEYPSTFHAEMLSNRGLSITAAGGSNIFRPMSMVRALATATEEGWRQFFAKYIADGAPGVLHQMAIDMLVALEASKPTLREIGEWHLPYIDFHTVEDACCVALEDVPAGGLSREELDTEATNICLKISVIRSYNVSLLASPLPRTREYHAERMKFYAELLALYEAMRKHYPLSSAFEHQAQPDVLKGHNPLTGFNLGWAFPQYHGNFRGWRQHRMMFIEPVLVSRADVQPKEQANG